METPSGLFDNLTDWEALASPILEVRGRFFFYSV
jgi:hypothetical protein